MENFKELFNTALKYHQTGNLDPAEASYNRVLEIEPGHVAATFLLGTVNLQKGNFDRATTLMTETILLNPDYADAYNILGVIFQKQGKSKEAIESYENALRLEPGKAETYNNLGAVLIETDRPDEAMAKYRQAISLNPNYAEAYYNLGNALKQENKRHEAIRNYRKAIELNPNYVDAHNNLGATLKDLGRYDESLEEHLKAVSLSPNHAEAHNNCGIVLQEQGKLNEALVAFDKAIASKSDYADARFNRSMLLLLKGCFSEAWPGYEERLCTKDYGLKSFKQPKWDGSSLKGKSVLVHTEQGFGDTIQFIRYLPLIQSQGGRVIFECWPQLLHLLENGTGINKIVDRTASGEPVEEVDFYIPLMSLPGIFNTKLETIPSSVPYIDADIRRVDEWRRRLADNDYFRIGLVWSGNPENRNIHHKRSCCLNDFTPLSKVSGVKFYSLQKGLASAEALDPPEGMDIINLDTELKDFSDTAAVIVNLDLIVSVDTAVAHLAGALGKPVWTLLPFVPEWRWLVDREDSPWYPTMCLFRQKHPGRWDGVFECVGQALREKVVDLSSKKSRSKNPQSSFIIENNRMSLGEVNTIRQIETIQESSPTLRVGEISNQQSTISLCMIVRDEEHNLTRCLDSVHSLVDEMIIVDTGSTDKTVEKAKRYGANIYYHAWENSFSTARNYSLQYATSQWILIMDADEELDKSDVSSLKDLIKSDDYSAISFVVKNRSKNSHNESYTNSIRLFKNFQGTRYDGIVHNELVFRGRCLASTISIIHYGYNLPEEEMEKKFLRTSSLLQQQIRTDPCNPVPHRYLGILYLEKGTYGKAINESKIALGFAETEKRNKKDFLISYYVISAASYESGKLQEAESYAQRLLGLDNRYLDGFCILAFVYYDWKMYDNFLKVSERYLALLSEVADKPKGYDAVTFHTVGHKWKIHLLRGFAFLSDNQKTEGDVEIEMAIGATPDIKSCLTLLGDYYRENNNVDKAEEIYLELLEINETSADTLFKIGQVKVKKGKFEEAISFWKKAVTIDPSLFGIRLLICKINISLDKYEDIVAECDQLLKVLNLPRDLTLTGIDDLGGIFETIGNKLYERDDVPSAETAFKIKSDLKRIQSLDKGALS